MSNRINFQLELIKDKVVQESFQKIQDFLCSQNKGSLDAVIKETVTIINEVDVTPALTLLNVLCDSTVYKQAAVRVSAGKCVNARADTFANSRITGFCVDKPDPTHADIVLFGQTDGIFVGLNEAQDYYLSASVAGAITVTPPAASGNVIQKVGRPGSASKLNVNIMLSMIV